jgi:hypothetical protein
MLAAAASAPVTRVPGMFGARPVQIHVLLRQSLRDTRHCLAFACGAIMDIPTNLQHNTRRDHP